VGSNKGFIFIGFEEEGFLENNRLVRLRFFGLLFLLFGWVLEIRIVSKCIYINPDDVYEFR
jgi:hypothetical protein